MKRNSEQKLIKKLFSIHEVASMRIIDHFINDGRATSESDVVRQALMFYHDKIYPNYIFHLSPAGQKKKKKSEEEEALASVPPEDFVRDTLKGVIVKNNKDKEFVLMHTIANSLMAIPYAGIKEWAAEHASDIAYHIKKLEDRTMDEAMHSGGIRQNLFSVYGILIE